MAEGFEGPQQDGELAGGARGAMSQARETAASTGRDLLDRAVEKKDELKQRATSAVDDRRMDAVGRVDAISRALQGAASSLRDSGETQLSSWVEQAAGQVERVVGYMQGKPADGMLHDFEDLARRNPALFLGGTYLAGMAVGRFLRASTPDPSMHGEPLGERAAFGDADGAAPGTPWTGVGLAPSAQGGDTGPGTADLGGSAAAGFGASGVGLGTASDGFAPGSAGRATSGPAAGDGEPGLTDEDLRDAWHGADESRSPDTTRGTGYGARGMSSSDSLDTGELTSYTNGDERDSDPRRGV